MTRRIAYLIPLLVGLGLAIALSAELAAQKQRYTQEARLDVFYKLSNIRSSLEAGLNSRQQMAEAFRSFIQLHPDIDQETFASLAKGFLGGVTGVTRIKLAKDNVISHVYPVENIDQLKGRSLLTDFPLGVRELAKRTIEERHRQLSTPISVLGGGKVIASATPVFLNNDDAMTGEYWGMILILIDIKTLFRESGVDKYTPSLELAIRTSAENLVSGVMLYGQESVFNMLAVSMNIPIPNGYWQIAAAPLGGWPESPNYKHTLYGGAGIIVVFTGLLLVTVYFLLDGIKEREKYRHLVQNAKSIILRIDMAGRITFCNEYAEKFFGYGEGELLDAPLVGTLIPEKSVEGKSMKRFVNKLLLDPDAHHFNETLCTRKNGEMTWVAWANESVLNRKGSISEVLCVGTDITDRKITEEALKQSERQYRVLAENVTDIIIGLDAEQRYTYVSPSDEALRGYGRHEVLSQPIGDFLSQSSRRTFGEAMDRLLSKKDRNGNTPSSILDLEFNCADGSTVWLETRFGLMLNDAHEIIGFQGVGRDISDRKRAEALREDVERIARHDLKTPLGAVIGLPDEIRRLGGLSPIQEDMLGTIQEAGDTMLELINNSLNLFKMESGTYQLKKTRVDVLRILESIKNETRTIVRSKGISVGVEIAGSIEEEAFYVVAEEPLFRSMLSNLLMNAFQSSPDGGIVSVVLAHGQDATICIRNKGEVPPELRDTFFDKYSNSHHSGGSGIGTYSARLIARTHGGDISVDTSTPDETRVCVILPQ